MAKGLPSGDTSLPSVTLAGTLFEARLHDIEDMLPPLIENPRCIILDDLDDRISCAV